MRVKQGFVLRKVAKRYVAIPVGSTIKEYSGLVQLNETGFFLWNHLKQETSEMELAEALTAEYQGLSMEQALQDVRAFLAVIGERGLLEE